MPFPQLLVSVRSALEAEAALSGGASVIDVKNPALGSLGPAAESTIASVIHLVGGRVPVSAARGELEENAKLLPRMPLHYVKWGLARSGLHWPQKLLEIARGQTALNPDCRPVGVAYADWHQAESPPPNAVLAFVREKAWKIFLLDTWKKDGRTLLDWLSVHEVSQLCQECRQKGIAVALAGSLKRDQICQLLPLEPDIFAVRGAVCRGKNRQGTVDSCRVRELAELLTLSHPILES